MTTRSVNSRPVFNKPFLYRIQPSCLFACMLSQMQASRLFICIHKKNYNTHNWHISLSMHLTQNNICCCFQQRMHKLMINYANSVTVKKSFHLLAVHTCLRLVSCIPIVPFLCERLCNCSGFIMQSSPGRMHYVLHLSICLSILCQRLTQDTHLATA